MWSDVRRKIGTLLASPTWPMVRVDGRVWHLSPEGEATFAAHELALDRWIIDGSAAVVKHGPHRTVYRVVLDGETIFVKQCRLNGPRAWAREVLRPPKARLEFENASRLRGLGIGAAIPLAWGAADSPWPGESFLITRDLAPAVLFIDFLEMHLLNLPPDVRALSRRNLAHGLGRFIALLHDGGVTHPDPHPGNMLIDQALQPEKRVAPDPRFSLLDVHAVRFGPPLSWAESRENLILYNRWFQLRASAADRRRFWNAYRQARRSLQVPDEAVELERATLASNRRFWIARTARYNGTHRTIRKIRIGEYRGLAVRDLPESFLTTLLADPDEAFHMPGVRILKQCVHSTIAEMEMPTPSGPRPVILKRVTTANLLAALKNVFRTSAIRRSWLFGHGLCERWLPTPRPLAFLHRYRFGIPAAGFLLTEKVPDALCLSEAVNACRDTRLLRTWADRIARLIRQLHDRGISHRDLKAPNIMLQGVLNDPAAAVPVLIDLVGLSASKDVPSLLRRAKQLARLNASFLGTPAISRTLRLRFLLAYLRAGERELDWKKWWRLVSVATAAKVAKNRRSGRVIG